MIHKILSLCHQTRSNNNLNTYDYEDDRKDACRCNLKEY